MKSPGVVQVNAGPGRRLAALAYDFLLVIALWFFVGALMLLLSGGRLSSPDRPAWLLVLFQCTLLLTAWLFFAWFWTHGGQTLGMRAWRLKLVGIDGGPVRWRQAIVRFVAAVFSAAALGLGFLWVLIDPERRSWHDHLSGTRIVLVPKSSPATGINGSDAGSRGPH